MELRSNSVLAEKQTSEVGRFICLVSYSSPGGRILDEMLSRV